MILDAALNLFSKTFHIKAIVVIKEGKTMKETLKENRLAIGIIVGFIALIAAVGILIPTSPISPFHKDTTEVDRQIESVKDYYEEQGIDLADSDINVETITNEEGEEEAVISVSDVKQNQAKSSAQSNLDKVIGDAIGVTPPTRDPETGEITTPSGGTDPSGSDSVFPSIDDIVETVNVSNARVREFINNSLNAQDEYGKLLLDQRWTDNPSTTAAFPYILYSSESTYGQLQPTLNGECFFYANYPESIKLNNQTHYYPWLNTSSDALYSNLISKKLYENDITTNLVIESHQGKTYTLVNSTSTFQYQSLVKVKCNGVSYILGMRNNNLLLLDAE